MPVSKVLKQSQAQRQQAIADEVNFQNKLKERMDIEVPKTADAVQPSARGYQRAVLPGHEILEKQHLGHRRYQVLKDIRDMAKTDTRISRMLYKLASDAVFKSFTVTVDDQQVGKRMATRVTDIVNRTRHLIQDKKHLRGWIESLLRDGDLFLQLVVDGMDMEIVRAKKLAAEMTFSRLNPEGDFPKDKTPYYQAHAYDLENEIRTFDKWEIVHVKWRAEDGMPYGSPLFESARLAYQRVDSAEKNIAIRRQFRTGRRLLFNVGSKEDPSTWEEVEEFKNQNRDALDNPQNPATDFFMTGQGSIDEITGDVPGDNTDDVKHFEGLLHIAGFTSQAQMSGGRESSSNYAVIDSQDEDYLRTLGHIDASVEEGLRQIFDTALLLKGVLPDLVEYVLNWGAKDRYSLDKKLLRAGLIIEAGFSHQTAYEIADLDNDISYDDEMERIRKQIRDGTIPYTGPSINRGLASRKKEEEDNMRLGDGK